MKLDPSYLPFISKEELRILATIELGMRNHEYVPIDLICKMVKMRGGWGYKTVQRLLKNKMIVHVGGKGQGYKLTFLGYDYLALTTFIKRGLIKTVLSHIGVGKQSDIYKCLTPDGSVIVLKLTRLGRNSFRSIKKNRQYVGERKGWNWLYMSRLSAVRQFGFMRLLYRNGFATPTPIDTNRHAILMSLLPGSPLCHVQRIRSQAEIQSLFLQSRELICKFAQSGLIHGDFNQFNLIVQGEEEGGGKGGKVRVIDFPQCISIAHPNAQEYFNRDMACIYKYFSRIAEKSHAQELKERQQIIRERQEKKRLNGEEIDLKEQDPSEIQKMFDVSEYPMPQLAQCIPNKRLDHQFTESNHIKLKEQQMLEEFRKDQTQWNAEGDGDGDDEGQEEEGQEKEGQEEEDQNEDEHEQIHQQQEKDIQQKEEEQIQEQLQKLDLEQIKEAKKELPKYDQELHNLISQFQNEGDNENEENKLEENQGEKEGGDEMPLTPYEIRQQQKAAKQAKLKKRKEELSTQQYIREAVKRRGNKSHGGMKGNFGKRGQKAGRQREIKEGLM